MNIRYYLIQIQYLSHTAMHFANTYYAVHMHTTQMLCMHLLVCTHAKNTTVCTHLLGCTLFRMYTCLQYKDYSHTFQAVHMHILQMLLVRAKCVRCPLALQAERWFFSSSLSFFLSFFSLSSEPIILCQKGLS